MSAILRSGGAGHLCSRFTYGFLCIPAVRLVNTKKSVEKNHRISEKLACQTDCEFVMRWHATTIYVEKQTDPSGIIIGISRLPGRQSVHPSPDHDKRTRRRHGRRSAQCLWRD